MKKIIITSACTLVLSLMGTFGLNQNSFNFNDLLNSTSNTSAVENNLYTDAQQSLPSDKQTNVTATVTEATNIEKNTVTPDNVVYANATKPATGVLSATINYSQKNAQVIVYKNVDLSKCKSVKEVVSTLQKNGFKHITRKNVYKIKSLKNVLALIKANNAKNTAPTIAPKTKPIDTLVKPTATPIKPTATPIKPTATPIKPTATPTITQAPTTKPTPTITPSTTTTTNNSGISSYAGEVLRLVNIERAKAGLSALTTNSTISAAANKRAQETKQSFSHTRPDGTSFSTVLTEFGVTFRAAGENIAYGQKTPKDVVTAWMNSPGHRANILNSSFGKIGIGVYQSNGVIYWAQVFTN